MEEGTSDAARTGRENRKNNNLEESREAEERRRRVVCWKKWMAGPMRATRRLGLGCQSGARLSGKNGSTTSDWRYAIGSGPGAPQQRLSVGQVPSKTWAVLEQGKAWTAASSWLKVLRTRCPRVPLRGTQKAFLGGRWQSRKNARLVETAAMQEDGREGWPRAPAYGKPRTESFQVPCSSVVPARQWDGFPLGPQPGEVHPIRRRGTVLGARKRLKTLPLRTHCTVVS